MICLITPSGGRPDQFKLCAQWMQNQTYKGDVVWIIVDDCNPKSTSLNENNYPKNWTILHDYPKPYWKEGQNSQARNISSGIIKLLMSYPRKMIEGIFIIEDDDYYKPIYLEKMVPKLGNYWAVGERNSIYYNVKYRKYQINVNNKHSSLFQTAISVDALPLFESFYKDKYIDLAFWYAVPEDKKLLFNDGNYAVGIKGMPGRSGIGGGHGRYMCMNGDLDLEHLKRLIGDDFALYEKFYNP